jgi:hypothetical protein
MKLTPEQRKERLIPVEREIRRIAHPPAPDPSLPLIIGNAPFRPNVLASRVNALALADELDALRAECDEWKAKAVATADAASWADKRWSDAEAKVLRIAEAVREACADEVEDYIDNADLCGTTCRDEVSAAGINLRQQSRSWLESIIAEVKP